jgi:outer membrane exchange protein TraA
LNQVLPPIVITGDPVALSPVNADMSPATGTGLCGAFKSFGADPAETGVIESRSGGAGYPANHLDYSTEVNALMDGTTTSGGVDGTRIDATMTTAFDLSNQYANANVSAIGDFQGTAGCPPNPMGGPSYGCNFPGSAGQDSTDSFGARYRGYINVVPTGSSATNAPQAGQPIHFGLLADTVSVSVWDVQNGLPQQYLLLSRTWEGASSQSWRVTQEITFNKPGLYPIEIVYVHFDYAANLEFGMLFCAGCSDGMDFVDIDEGGLCASLPMLSASVSGMAPGVDRPAFSLAPTMPANFFQTASGAMSFPGQPAICQQCPRQYAGIAPLPPGICPAGAICNQAALCQSCDYTNPQTCGPNCVLCDNPTPICHTTTGSNMNGSCVQCEHDSDCAVGSHCLNLQCTPPPVPDGGGGMTGGSPGGCSCMILGKTSAGRDSPWALLSLLPFAMCALFLRRRWWQRAALR